MRPLVCNLIINCCRKYRSTAICSVTSSTTHKSPKSGKSSIHPIPSEPVGDDITRNVDQYFHNKIENEILSVIKSNYESKDEYKLLDLINLLKKFPKNLECNVSCFECGGKYNIVGLSLFFKDLSYHVKDFLDSYEYDPISVLEAAAWVGLMVNAGCPSKYTAICVNSLINIVERNIGFFSIQQYVRLYGIFSDMDHERDFSRILAILKFNINVSLKIDLRNKSYLSVTECQQLLLLCASSCLTVKNENEAYHLVVRRIRRMSSTSVLNVLQTMFHSSLVKSPTSLESRQVLSAIETHFMEKIQDMKSHNQTLFIHAFTKLRHENLQLLNVMCDHISMDKASICSLRNPFLHPLVASVFMMRKFRFFNKRLLDCFGEAALTCRGFLESDIKHFSLRQHLYKSSLVLKVFATFRYLPQFIGDKLTSKICEINEDHLIRILQKRTHRHAAQDDAYCSYLAFRIVRDLAVLGCIRSKLFLGMLESVNHQMQLLVDGSSRMPGWKILGTNKCLFNSLLVYQASQVSDPLNNPAHFEIKSVLSVLSKSFKHKLFEIQLKDDLFDICGGSSFIQHCVFSHFGHRIDHVVSVDGRGQFQLLNWREESSPFRFLHDLYTQSSQRDLAAILVCERAKYDSRSKKYEGDFCINSNQMLGLSYARILQIHKSECVNGIVLIDIQGWKIAKNKKGTLLNAITKSRRLAQPVLAFYENVNETDLIPISMTEKPEVVAF